MTTSNAFQTITEYIATFSDETRNILESMRRTIHEAAPNAEETISYRIPTFKINSHNLVHFAGYKNHIGFYPTPSAIKAFAKELARWPAGKGSVKFSINEPLPLDLIQKIVRFRVREIMKK